MLIDDRSISITIDIINFMLSIVKTTDNMKTFYIGISQCGENILYLVT